MIYFCADDYGISKNGNYHIENCLKNSVLNKVSILPNGEISGFKNNLTVNGCAVSLHLNLVEGKPLSNPDDVELLIAKDGCFRYSFIGLFLKSLLPGRKDFEEALYKELKSQIKFWKDEMGNMDVLSIDSHQHTHMIPLVFKALMRAIKDEGVKSCYMRIPAEPILPYILTPSLYFNYSIIGIIKQWLLKFLWQINKKEFNKTQIRSGYFMGVLFSGRLSEKVINKILPRYIRLAEKREKDIEIGFHPGYIENEDISLKNRDSFEKFYLSSQRKSEYDTLMNLKI